MAGRILLFLQPLLAAVCLHAGHIFGQLELEAAGLSGTNPEPAIPPWGEHSMDIQPAADVVAGDVVAAGAETIAEDVGLIAVVVVVAYTGVGGRMEEDGEIDGIRHK